MVVTDSDLKLKGINAFDRVDEFIDAFIEIDGKAKYVVLDIQRYKELREMELLKLYEEIMEDIKNGDYKVVSAKEHIEDLKKSLENV